MKVILISDVENIGSVGDVKDVKNGMARNYLFPRKLAIKATEANLKAWESRIEAIRLRKTEILENAKALAEKLEGLEISIPAKSGEEDRLFGSVTSQNISDALGEKGFEISRRDIALDGTIKALGTYSVALKLHTDVTQQITVNVVKEEE
jgi:large subunit ribosomal protein L9